MNSVQLSIRAVFAVTAFIAVACAALAKPSFLWASALWTLTMAVLAMGLVAIACRRDRSRIFWMGFSLFGWGHMILTLAPWFDDNTGEFILTRQLLDLAGHALGHDVAEITTMPGIWRNLPYASTPGGYTYLTYLVAGQSLFTLLVATVGGFATRCISDAGDQNSGCNAAQNAT